MHGAAEGGAQVCPTCSRCRRPGGRPGRPQIRGPVLFLRGYMVPISLLERISFSHKIESAPTCYGPVLSEKPATKATCCVVPRIEGVGGSESRDRKTSGCQGLRGEDVWLPRVSRLSFWGNENVLDLETGDGGPMLRIY